MNQHAGHDEPETPHHDETHAVEAPLEEAHTPGWLTAIGLALFLLAGIAFLVTRPAPAPTVEEAQPVASEAAVVPQAPAAPVMPPGGRPNIQQLMRRPPGLPPPPAQPGHEGHGH